MKYFFKGENRANKVINEITSCILIAMRNLNGEKMVQWERSKQYSTLPEKGRSDGHHRGNTPGVSGKEKICLNLVESDYVSSRIGSEFVFYFALYSTHDDFKDSCKTR